MARRIKPVPTSTLAADDATVKALQGLIDYQPTNPAYSTAQLLQVQATLTQAEQADKVAQVTSEQAHNVWAETTHFYHDLVVNARTQVIAQYGADATAVSLVGLTRKSERKQPVKRKAKA
jgi:hypothetical protein